MSSKRGMHGVVGDRMVGSWSEMNPGSRSGEERRSWRLGGPEEACPEGERALVVGRKRGNARGAKGGRKVEPLNQRRREANTVNVLWTQCGDEHQRCKPSAAARWLLAASETRVNHGSSLNDPWLRRSISSGVNYQLESRMQEICQSGSEGGAIVRLSLPLFIAWAVRPRECEKKASSAEGAAEMIALLSRAMSAN